MSEQQQPEELIVNEQIDEVIKKDDIRENALRGEDYVLRVAARINGGAHPAMSGSERDAVRARVSRAAAALPKVTVEEAARRQRRARNNSGGGFFSTLFRSAFIIFLIGAVLFFARPYIDETLPGDWDYIIKEQYERVDLLLAFNSTSQIEAHLAHTNQRLNEFYALPEESPERLNVLDRAAVSLDSARAIGRESLTFQIDDPLRLEAIRTLQRMTNALEEADYPDGAPSTIEETVSRFVELLSNIEDQDVLLMDVELPPEVTPEATAPTSDDEGTTDENDDADETPIAPISTTDATDADDDADDSDADAEETEPAAEETADPEATEDDVTDADEPTPTATVDGVTDILFVDADVTVNVRSGAGTQFGVVGFAQPGDSVVVLTNEEGAEWIEIRLEDGTEGWIASFLLTEEP